MAGEKDRTSRTLEIDVKELDWLQRHDQKFSEEDEKKVMGFETTIDNLAKAGWKVVVLKMQIILERGDSPDEG